MPNLSISAGNFAYTQVAPNSPDAKKNADTHPGARADRGYGYGGDPGQIGEYFTANTASQSYTVAYDSSVSVDLGSILQSESVGTGPGASGDYFFRYEGTGGGGAVAADGTITDPYGYLTVSLPISIAVGAQQITDTFTANVSNGGIKLYEGPVSDKDVDYILDLGSKQYTLADGSKLALTFKTTSLSSQNETQTVSASLTLQAPPVTNPNKGPAGFTWNTSALPSLKMDDIFATITKDDLTATPKSTATFTRQDGALVVLHGSNLSKSSITPGLNPFIFTGNVASVTVESPAGTVVATIDNLNIGLDAFTGNTSSQSPFGNYLTFTQSYNATVIQQLLQGDNVVKDNSTGAHYLSGYDGNDTLSGAAGDDTLDGGRGRDTALYVLNRTQYQVSRADGVTTVRTLSGSEGTDTLRNVEVLRFSDQDLVLPRARTDLNGDGISDILFQQGSSVVRWGIQNGQVQSAAGLGGAGSYRVAAAGDITGDGTADVLFQDGSSIVAWQVQNGQVQASAGIGNAGSYQLVASGDFNGDGTADVLFQDGGSIVAWQMQNGQVQSASGLGNAGDYQVVGTGDLNGDGTDDIVFQSGASVVAWIMGNGQVQSVANLGNAGDYRVAGVGDLNGDGRADLVFQSGASVADWIMGTNAQVQSTASLGNAGGYAVSAVSDYNGDGTADVLFQQGASVVAWEVQNSQVQSLLNLGNAGGYTVVA